MVKKSVMMYSSVHAWNDTRIFYKEAMALANAGFKIDFYGVENDSPVVEHPNITLHLLKASEKKSGRFHRWRVLYQRVKQSDADYYHIHDPELLSFFYYFRKKKSEAQFIYDMHENFPLDIQTKEWIPKVFRGVLTRCVRVYEKVTMSSCDHVIMAEESYQLYYSHLKCPITIIRNYPRWVEKNEEKRKTGPFTLIYVGGITEDRGLWEMLQLIKRLNQSGRKKYQLKLVGPTGNDLQSAIDEFIQEEHLGAYVEVYGRIPYSDIWSLLEQSDIGLCLLHPLPNYLESMATKLYEYMAASLPILCSNFPAWEKLVLQADCGEVCPPFDLNKLEWLIRNRADYREKNRIQGQNGREAYEQFYLWEHEEKKLLQEVYMKEEF